MRIVKLFSILLLLLLTTGCGSGYAPTSSGPIIPIYPTILDWQSREKLCTDSQRGLTGVETVDLEKIYEISRYVSQTVVYSRDSADYWKTSCEVEADSLGDCEDRCHYLYELIRQEGLVPDHALFMTWLVKGDLGHMVLTVEDEDGMLWVFDVGIPPMREEQYLSLTGYNTLVTYNLFEIM